MKNILVTGGAGFIGSNFIHYMLDAHPDYTIINLDALTYAGNLSNLKSVEKNPHYHFIKGNISNFEMVEHILTAFAIDAIVNFAAESHVDRSIMGPEIFIETNVKGTVTMLEAARKFPVDRFLQVSTDEVYGSLGSSGKFTEQTHLAPNSPYSASKASADMIARSYFKTFRMPVLITRCSNNYGPFQFPEKLIPLMIKNALEDKPLPVYGEGKNVRDWIHVKDHAKAIDAVLHRGTPGEIYNVGSDNEWENIAIVKEILSILNKPEALIKFVKDRPGHDFRYAIDSSKMHNQLGWSAEYNFHDGLRDTIDWYLANQEWVSECTSGSYTHYYDNMYKNR
ncbi:MAG: dTDP-glucose 4,6-dehydratase [Candidatus Auribacter fodinae]|uniref:dTDP-glucose 4,6-dehydratase n=1 Tax=Candidatus Auribacter fodinae TaxID=2093366 RepID=A0A3A4R9X8_9BACT|nr:MAG: dTDP-glucose 4,6-dehydratase [Candidatus Auribacter fodinae]